MPGPHKNFPLSQREFHEQAAAIAFKPEQWPDLPPRTEPAPPVVAAPNPFVRNPELVKEES